MCNIVVSESVDTSLSLRGKLLWLIRVLNNRCSVSENSTRWLLMDISLAGLAIFAFLWEESDFFM
jgi:hypothetical protein